MYVFLFECLYTHMQMSGSIHSGDIRLYHTFIHIFRICQYIWRTLQGFQRRQRADHSCVKKMYVHMYVYMYIYICKFMYAYEKRAAFTEEIEGVTNRTGPFVYKICHRYSTWPTRTQGDTWNRLTIQSAYLTIQSPYLALLIHLTILDGYTGIVLYFAYYHTWISHALLSSIFTPYFCSLPFALGASWDVFS